MNDLSCDLEVFAFDWLVDYYDDETDVHNTFHNDYQGVKEFMERGNTLYGFNFKRYDRYILNAILNGKSPEEIKALNDDIVKYDIQGWESVHSKKCYAHYNFYDLFDDTQTGTSLKSFEAHMGYDITESEVSFDLNRSLNTFEIEQTIYYVRKDTEYTAKMKRLRKNYLDTKVRLGEKCGLTREESLYLTNAKLTAKYLKAVAKKFYDDREYVFPSNIDYKYIPKVVYDFFDKIHDESLNIKDVLSESYEFKIGDCDVTIAWGGIHGAILGYREKATDNRVILNVDGDSFYPSIDIAYKYVSRALTDPMAYPDVVKTRLEYKHSGVEELINMAKDLKLIVNTTYGCKGDKYNDLYDFLNRLSTCITGQLLLLWLSYELFEVPTCKIIQINTDGVMISVDKEYLPQIEAICVKWQEQSMISLDRDNISEIIQRDVNNYIEVQTDGSMKVKGGTLVRGVSKAGAFSINNQAPIMSKALIEYLVHGTPISDTIGSCTDPLEFQLICKASHKYDGAYHEVNGERISVQMCNRVYATCDKKYGVLYKTQGEKWQKQVAGTIGLPEHCIVDNKNKISIDEIDKQWYIDNTYINALKFVKTDDKVVERTKEYLKRRREQR